jgi:ABC-2 type transport system permease protein
MMKVYHTVEPYLHDLPPGLAGRAVLRQTEHAPGAALAMLGGVLVFAAACLAVFAWRMEREYRGEKLGEAASGAAKRSPQEVVAKTGAVHPAEARAEAPERQGLLSPVVAACYEKEWIYVRRNPTQFYGLIAPLAMILIFKVPMSNLAKSGTVFPAAVAYAVLGVAMLAYNSLGLDANGVQFYFLAPVTLRSVMLGKNLFSFSIIALQVALVYLMLIFTSGAPPLAMTLSTIAWVAFACLVNTTVGNMRSIKAPKKIDPSKISRRQQSQLSALLCLGLMLVASGLGAGLIALAKFARMPWLAVPILAGLAVGAFALYVAGLNRVDGMALDCREDLVEELSKAS